MSCKTTRQADQDIIDIYVHGVQEFGTAQVERYHQGLLRTFELLSANPRLARKRTEFVPPVRIHPFEAHLIIYMIWDDGILIVRVLHGRHKWELYL
jgi:toxin ParE1/3/4